MSELKPGIPFVQINIESPKDPPSGDFILSEEETSISVDVDKDAFFIKDEGGATANNDEEVEEERIATLEDDLQEVIVSQDSPEER